MMLPRRSIPVPCRAAAGVALSLAGMVSCQSAPAENSGRPEARPAHNAPPQQIVPAIFQALDTDRNGMTDSLVVFAYLFPAADASALPVWADGEFRFSLTSRDFGALAHWTFPSDQVRAHRDTDTFGPTHSFTLDIKAAAGRDDFESQNAALSAAFIRTDGVTISSAGSVGVQLGR